jgi:hypothetical protein
MNNTNLKKLKVDSKFAIDIAKPNKALKYLEVDLFLIPHDLNDLRVIVNAVIYNNTVLEGAIFSVSVEGVVEMDTQVYMETNYKELTIDSRIFYD